MTVAVLNWAIKRVEAGERVAIASVVQASGSVPGKPGARLAISSSGEKFGTIGGAGLELTVEKELQEILFRDLSDLRKKGGKVEVFLLNRDGKGKEASALDSLCGGRVTVAMEVITPRPHILIAGGGHVGLSIARVCDSLEWPYSVFDIREEYCNQQRYPNSEWNFCSSVEDFLMSENIVHISDSSFEQDVLQADGPVLVDFWAEWCGPCKMIAPVLEEIAVDYEGKLKICKMDVDANTATAPKFGIRGIPTLILFNNGDKVGEKVGALSKSQLAAFIDSAI